MLWGCKSSVTDKAFNKFKKPEFSVRHSDPRFNPVVLPFYSLIAFKISKIVSRVVFKVSFKPVNRIKFSSLKDSIITENWSGISFILCPCNLGYIGQTRNRLKPGWMSIVVKLKVKKVTTQPLLLIVGLIVII